jgi:hypothetical protein
MERKHIWAKVSIEKQPAVAGYSAFSHHGLSDRIRDAAVGMRPGEPLLQE